jgi:hypothetical protein
MRNPRGSRQVLRHGAAFLIALVVATFLHVATNLSAVSLGPTSFPYPWFIVLYPSFYSSQWIMYGGLVLFTWACVRLWEGEQRHPSGRLIPSALLESNRSPLWITCACLVFFIGWRFVLGYGYAPFSLLARIFFGLEPRSSPYLIHIVPSFFHVAILVLLITWVVPSYARSQQSPARQASFLLAVGLALPVCIGFLELEMENLPVAVPQTLALLFLIVVALWSRIS